MEFNKKEMDITFEKFLKNSAAVINQRKQNSLKKVNSSYKNKIFLELKYIFDLDSDLSINNFKTNFIKKTHTSKTCKENIIKMIYLLIFKDEIKNKEDIKNKVDDIVDLIKKMKDSDLPLPKSYLIKNLKKLKMIKLVKIKEKDRSSQIESELTKFKNNSKLSVTNITKIIDLLIKHMKTTAKDEEKSEKLEQFCEIFNDKLLNQENQYDPKKFIEFSKNIIPKLEELDSVAGIEKDSNNINLCINTCKSIIDNHSNKKETFEKIQKNREDKSHNKESLQHFYDLQESTIDRANEIINQFEDMEPIDKSKLPKLKKCETFLKESSDEDLNKEVFDSYAKEMMDETQKAISKRLQKSKFGTKAPNSKSILSEILDLF